MKIKICLLLICLGLFSACKSLQKNSPAVNLVFLIVDENEKAVSDYQLTVAEQRNVTNSRGLCLFYNLPAADYILSGKKSAYTVISDHEVPAQKSSEIICLRVFTKDFILNQAQELFEEEDYSKALELLQRLCCEKDPLLENTLLFHQAYCQAKLGQKEKAGLLLQKMAELEDPAFESQKYCQAIEGLFADPAAP